MDKVVSFKDSFRYCEDLGCTFNANIQWCCPELMELCIRKTKLLKEIDPKLIELAYSNDVNTVNYLNSVIDEYLISNDLYIVYGIHFGNDKEYAWNCTAVIYNNIQIGDILKVETSSGNQLIKVTRKSKSKGVVARSNNGYIIQRNVVRRIEI